MGEDKISSKLAKAISITINLGRYFEKLFDCKMLKSNPSQSMLKKSIFTPLGRFSSRIDSKLLMGNVTTPKSVECFL